LAELSKHLPELTNKIQLPNLSAIIDFFALRSSQTPSVNQEAGAADETVNNPSNKKVLNVFAQIKDFEK